MKLDRHIKYTCSSLSIIFLTFKKTTGNHSQRTYIGERGLDMLLKITQSDSSIALSSEYLAGHGLMDSAEISLKYNFYHPPEQYGRISSFDSRDL